LKGNGTEVAEAVGVPLAFKMEQLKGVSIHNLLQSNPKHQSKFRTERRKLGEWEYFT
jgi:hypothetical protein